MSEINKEVCAHVLWHYGDKGGLEPGGFTKSLLEAIMRADPVNKAKLARGFPEYVAAMELPAALLQAVVEERL